VVSYDLTGAAFDAQRYWRGPTWLNTTWLVARGLKTHGRDELAEILYDDIVSLVRQSGLREYFNPYTGSGHGTADFSWSAALLLDVLAP
jgi:glycogen debranching enzyme